MKTAEFIKVKRGEKKLSLADLAKSLTLHGYSTQKASVWQWEQGLRNPPLEKVEFRVALAASFEMDVNDLMTKVGFVVSDDERSPEALYIAEVVDRLPEDEKEEIVEYVQMVERRYLKKTALMS